MRLHQLKGASPSADLHWVDSHHKVVTILSNLLAWAWELCMWLCRVTIRAPHKPIHLGQLKQQQQERTKRADARNPKPTGKFAVRVVSVQEVSWMWVNKMDRSSVTDWEYTESSSICTTTHQTIIITVNVAMKSTNQMMTWNPWSRRRIRASEELKTLLTCNVSKCILSGS